MFIKYIDLTPSSIFYCIVIVIEYYWVYSVMQRRANFSVLCKTYDDCLNIETLYQSLIAMCNGGDVCCLLEISFILSNESWKSEKR